jgi:ribonucleotide reductase beta subunit family protein with ferritin-like domain
MEQQEPLLKENPNRFVLFPIKDHDIWQLYKKMQAAIWTAEEIKLVDDLVDWEKLTDDEKHFIKYVLAFFAASDGIVLENLLERFSTEVQLPEARAAYAFQGMIENVHCVSGDTEILTDNGNVKIGENLGNYCNVWNGTEFSKVRIVDTGKKDLYRVQLSSGQYLDCTSGHKWMIWGYDTKIETRHLKPGHQLVDYQLPQQSPQLPFQAKILQDFQDYCEKSVNVWFQEEVSSFRVTGDKEMLSHYQTQLYNLGIIVHLKQYATGDWYLYVSPQSVRILISQGFKPRTFNVIENRSLEYPITTTIESVELFETNQPTYCFTEPKNGTGIFNGILTGQSETYSLLIDTYIKDEQEKDKLFNALETIPCVRKKAEWAQKWIADTSSSFATRLVAFAVVEGIFFSGSFCAIYWLKERGLMPGLTFSNELISRDEGLHCTFAVMLHKKLQYTQINQDTAHSIFREAVDIETEFITQALPCKLIGMNAESMIEYIKYVADYWLVQLGFEKLYDAKNPFDFMERISLASKGSFFEVRISDYSRADIVGGQTNFDTIDEDF